MKTIGIVDGHSASVALVEDGELVFALQEERPTREKNRGGFPSNAFELLLRRSNLDVSQIDHIGFSTNYYLNFGLPDREAILRMYRSAFVTTEEKQEWLSAKVPDQRKISSQQAVRVANVVELGYRAEDISFVEHHLCHASMAYYSFGRFNEQVLVLTCDGQGDLSAGKIFIGESGRLMQICDVGLEHSIAQVYSYITFLLGFVPLEHEYKLMGMAPYAENSSGARQVYEIFRAYYRFDNDDKLGWSRVGEHAYGHRLAQILEDELRFRRFDEICAGLQIFIEEFVSEWVERVVANTGIKVVAVSGGLFMNVKLNKRLAELPQIQQLFVAPSCGDESNSIGAAFHLYNARAPKPNKELRALYLGPEDSDDNLRRVISVLQADGDVELTRMGDCERDCAQLLANGEILARFSGRSEFGARALGNRSILARPDRWSLVAEINHAIKQRDFWMPFAPSILEEKADEILANYRGKFSPYMMQAFDVNPKWQSRMAAALHPYDKTCRPQIVREEWNPSYHKLLVNFEQLTGIPGVLNTSFNLHGFPIVDTYDDAVAVFRQSGLKNLALGDWLVQKSR